MRLEHRHDSSALPARSWAGASMWMLLAGIALEVWELDFYMTNESPQFGTAISWASWIVIFQIGN